MGKKSSSTTKPWSKAQPYILGAADTVQDAYKQNQPALQELTSGIQGGFSGLLSQVLGGDAGVDAAKGYGADVLSGKYLDSNPYVDSIVSQTADDVTNRVNGAIGARGRTGGDAHSQILSRELANASNQIRFNNYNQERQAMESAAGRAPGLATAEYAGIAPLLAYTGAAAELPYVGTDKLAGGLSGLLGQYSTTTQKQGAMGTLGNILGAGLAGWASGGFGGVK